MATGLIAHRGPDDEAYDLSPEFSAGFRRLSIIDLSDHGRQPMADETGRYLLVFNGEIYNYLELRDELTRAGWSFRTDSDTEVLLKALIHWGEDGLGKFNGMFAFLLWDRRERRLLGARDRFGEKPFYYAEVPDQVLFASEIKSLFPLLGSVPAYRPGVVRNYLQNGIADVGSDTFYQGISALPAAHKLILEDGRLRVVPYWRLEESEDFRGDPIEAFRALFLDAIRLRTRSDVPLGTCLSGGVDSGSIVCGLPHVLDNAPQITRKTFTASYREYDESAYVSRINQYSGSEGFAITPEPADLSDLERLLWFQDEPFHSFAVWAGYEVMRLARAHGIVVLLNGQGADELLGGYPYCFQYYLAQLLRRGRALRALAAARGAETFVGRGAARSLLAGQGYSWKWGLGRWLSGLRNSPWNRGRRRSRSRVQAMEQYCLRGEFLDRAEEDESRQAAGGTRDLFKDNLLGMLGDHLPLLLRAEDRISMAHSMEVRLPFLDHRLAELVFSMPSELFMKDGWNKYMLRQATAGILPDEVRLRRDKMGFPIPQAGWIYGPMRDQIRDLLASHGAVDEVFDAPRLRSRFEADAAAANRGANSFWFRVVSFVLWCRSRDSIPRAEEGGGDLGPPLGRPEYPGADPDRSDGVRPDQVRGRTVAVPTRGSPR